MFAGVRASNQATMDEYKPLDDSLDHLRSVGIEIDDNEYLYSRKKLFYLILRINFIIFDVILSALSFVVYIWASSGNKIAMNMFDVAQYCDDNNYNHKSYTVTNAGEYFSYGLMVAVFLCVWVTSYAEIGRGWRVMILKMIQRTWITTIGYGYLCICVYALQALFGHPVPYFFSNQNLYEFYCGTNDMYFADFLSLIDGQYAETCPSYFVALEWFSSALLVFYVDRCNLGFGPQATQFAIGVLCGAKCLLDGATLFENQEMYLTDMACVAIAAVLFAAFTAGNLKGPVMKNVMVLPIYVTNGILFNTLITASRHRANRKPRLTNIC